MIKILNLYSSLGGNRFKWNEVIKDLEVTAVELDPELARLYSLRFPNDKVIIADAHKFLLDNYRNYDFIWASPPCPTHSRAGFAPRKSENSGHLPVYPDLKLYEEIIFLDNYFEGKYCVENVIPYYEPLIPAQKRGRHLYWTNFLLPNTLTERTGYIMESNNEVAKWSKFHEYDFNLYNGTQRRDKVARNLVDYEAGRVIFETAYNIYKSKNTKQLDIFNS